MQCPVAQSIRDTLFGDIRTCPFGIDDEDLHHHAELFKCLMGANLLNLEVEKLLYLYKISGEHIYKMYSLTPS